MNQLNQTTTSSSNALSGVGLRASLVGCKSSPISQRLCPSEADIGWAAGILDGEGCIHIARQTFKCGTRRPVFRLRLQISQNDARVLKEFVWVVGVPGRLYSPKPVGKQNRVCHSLTYDGIKAFAVLDCLRDHLRGKREQADLAAEFRERCDVHRHSGPLGWPEWMWALREWYYERMSELKRN